MKTVGELIKKYRKDKSMSQLDLALKVGWENPSTLSRIEQGNVQPTKDTVMKIAESLELKNIQINALMNSAGFEQYKPELTKEYIDSVIENLSQEMNPSKYPVVVQLYNSEFVYWNDIAEKFFIHNNLSHSDVLERIGRKTLIEVLFDPENGIQPFITNWDEFARIIAMNMYVMSMLMPNDDAIMNYYPKWLKIPTFAEQWQKMSNQKDFKHTIYNIPMIYKHPKLGIVNFEVTTSFLYSDKRFVIQQIIPVGAEDIDKLSKL